MKTESMVDRHTSAFGAINSTHSTLFLLALLACLTAGCVQEPRPRSYTQFMDDSFAREGTLARCNQDREGTANDVECVNARRAASNLAARADEAQREQRDAESEILRAAASDRAASAQTAIMQAAEAAKENAEAQVEAQYEAQYEAQWAEVDASAQSTQPIQLAAAEPVGEATYRSLASTLSPVSSAEELRYAELPRPTLDFIELPASATPVLPYVELPATVRRLEPAPKPVLEEISIPARVTYLE